MRSGIHGTFATLLLMVPVLTIPALAIFGIPQFAPVVASPLDEGSSRDRERRVGQSERPAADDLLSDLDDEPSGREQSASVWNDEKPAGKLGDTVPVPRAVRNGPARNSTDSTVKEQYEQISRADSWGDDPPNDNRRQPGFASDSAVSNQPADRSGFDPRFAAAPADSKRAAQNVISRERRNDLVPVERTVPRPYQRERETAANSAGAVRQVSNVREPITWQSAIQRLNELEIRNFRLERGHRDNQFMFICSYTPSDSPRVSYRFEAEADEPLKAVDKVLEQIDEWRERR